MKDAATKSYAKKGADIVDMNHKAIDAGATAFVQVDVPEAWKTAEAAPETLRHRWPSRDGGARHQRHGARGRAWMATRCPFPPSSATRTAQFPLGASAYEKRGVAVSVPEWNPDTCIQCNQCSFVCPHATIRPFALTDAEDGAGSGARPSTCR